MDNIFLVCAVLGGVVMVAQFLMTLMGLGHHGGLEHDFSGDGGHDFSGHDVSSDNISSHGGGAGHAQGDAHAGHASTGHAHSARPTQHGSGWIFQVLTIRTVTAALTFFGLAGMAATSAQLQPPLPFAIALASGAGALYGVYWLMQSLYKLRSDGTVRIDRAVGVEGVVYLNIPGQNQGAGKVHITFQNRLVEYEAMTSGDPLPTGARIVVVGVLGPDRVEVDPATEIARQAHG